MTRLHDPLDAARSPYAVLAHARVTPDSSMQAVRDASYELMSAGGMDAVTRAAWDELRRLPSRVAVDFLLHVRPPGLRPALERVVAQRERDIEELSAELVPPEDLRAWILEWIAGASAAVQPSPEPQELAAIEPHPAFVSAPLPSLELPPLDPRSPR